jgi:hypothetical protein
VVLVTGYRGWDDKAAIARALTDVERAAHKREPGARMCLAHGGCNGADQIAATIARNKRWRVLTFHADFKGPDGPRSGPLRNQFMIDATRPHYALVFLHPDSKGTRDCLRRLEAYRDNAKLSRLVEPIRVFEAQTK